MFKLNGEDRQHIRDHGLILVCIYVCLFVVIIFQKYVISCKYCPNQMMYEIKHLRGLVHNKNISLTGDRNWTFVYGVSQIIGKENLIVYFLYTKNQNSLFSPIFVIFIIICLFQLFICLNFVLIYV